MYMFLNEVKFYFKEEDHAVYKFSLSNNYKSSLRTTTCDTLIVPSECAIYL